MPMTPSAGDSRRFRLRAATAQAHARLDGLVARQGFFTGTAPYAAYLAATWRARAGVEAGLDAAHAERTWAEWPRRRIAGHLCADLIDLDRGEALAAPLTEMTFNSEAEVLGALYVLEGSALGARVLTQSAALLGFDGGFGARHMKAQTENPSAWRAFLIKLDNYMMDPMEELACAASATAVFESFERELGSAAAAL